MINVALIGCGYWGSKLRRYIEENNDFNLRYICDSKSDLDEVWNDEQVNAVVIATRNDTHYSIAKAVLLHNKNVLCEKPLALKTEECEELKQIALTRNLTLTVEYTYTFSRSLRLAVKMVEEGEIGRVLGIEACTRHLGRFGGGSVYWLLGSHMLSVLDMFVPVKDLSFWKRDLVTFEGEVETGITLFEGENVRGQIVVSLNYPGKETRVIVYGEKGTIIYDPISRPSLRIVKYERAKWVVGDKLLQERSEIHYDESNNLRYVIEYFAQALRGEVESNIDRAVVITRVLEGL